MRGISIRMIAATVVALAVGCGGGGGGGGGGTTSGNARPVVPHEEGKDACIEISVVQSSTEQPAAVSLFFQVENCRGDPVRDLVDDSFTIFENGAQVSSFESRHQIFCKAQQFRSFNLLLLDLSASVIGEDGGGIDRLKEAAGGFVDSILLPVRDDDGNAHDTDVQRVAIYWFDGSATIYPLVDFTDDRAALLDGVASLDASFAIDNSTNLYGSVMIGVDTLNAARSRARSREAIPFTIGSLTIFTDGTDQAGRATLANALRKVTAYDNYVFTIGLGREIDATVLHQIGKSGSKIIPPGATPEDELRGIVDAFRDFGERIEAIANSFYLLKYCSPKRAGTHTLTLVATRGEETGQASSRFRADGFEFGCVIPDGTPLSECAR